MMHLTNCRIQFTNILLRVLTGTHEKKWVCGISALEVDWTQSLEPFSLSWGGCGTFLPWVFEGVRLCPQSYLPGRVAWDIFALGQVYCQKLKASDSPFLPLSAWWAILRNYFFLFCWFHPNCQTDCSPPLFSSTLLCVFWAIGGDASFHSALVIHPSLLRCLNYACELLEEDFIQSLPRLA